MRVEAGFNAAFYHDFFFGGKLEFSVAEMVITRQFSMKRAWNEQGWDNLQMMVGP